MSRPLVLLDLDQTVVFSERSAGLAGPSLVVERLDGARLSSMTTGAVAAYRELAARADVVPVTTRTVAQYRRITLPAPAPRAVCANGGVLLRDDAPDAPWAAAVADRLRGCAPLPQVLALLERDAGADWVRLVRSAEDLFCYLVAHSREAFPDGWVDALSATLEPQGWTVSLQGRKAYAVPGGLSKADAATALAGDGPFWAAGDSLLDRPLLEAALAAGGGAVRPGHGELHEQQWTTDGLHVTRADGARAGEELLRHLLAVLPA